jgi:hypothetical protein
MTLRSSERVVKFVLLLHVGNKMFLIYFNTDVVCMGYELILSTYIFRTNAGYQLSSDSISADAF